MPGVVRDGDKNDAGGAAKSSVPSVLVNNKPIVVVGDTVLPHSPFGKPHPPHAKAKTTGGVSSVIAGNKPVNVKGNSDTCGHSRADCSGDVVAG
jgi:uncharacterized Zn-binding protein involved in type VI secretion